MPFVVPKKCVSALLYKKFAIYVLEVPPLICSVKHHVREADPVIDYKVSWPRTLWFFRISLLSPGVYISSIDTEYSLARRQTVLRTLPMPNIDHLTGAVCLGEWHKQEKEVYPYHTGVEDLMTYVFNSVWNESIPGHYAAAGLTSMADWNAKTLVDPGFYGKLFLTPRLLQAAHVGFGPTVENFLKLYSRGAA